MFKIPFHTMKFIGSIVCPLNFFRRLKGNISKEIDIAIDARSKTPTWL